MLLYIRMKYIGYFLKAEKCSPLSVGIQRLVFMAQFYGLNLGNVIQLNRNSVATLRRIHIQEN